MGTGGTAESVASVFAPMGAVAPYEPPAVTHLVREVESGRFWADALLESVGLWRSAREVVRGQEFVYLIGGEAFDWLALASRLLAEVQDAVPQDERERLLLRGELPDPVTLEQFRESLGVAKYRAHLNFFYGVVVEEALWLALEHEVTKEQGVRGLQQGIGVGDAVSHRLYGADEASLVRRFRRSRGEKISVRFSLAEWKEFTYWLFKLRLSRWDSARIASDTRKGLRTLQRLRQDSGVEVFNACNPIPALS